MADIIIDGNTYFSYASVAEANEYLTASINYAIWNALDDDTKGRYLISATRFLDTLSWQDTCLPLTSEANIKTATILIAEQIALGNTVFLGYGTNEEDVKRYKAGSVEIEYQNSPWFLSRKGSPYADMPTSIYNLIRGCLEGAQGIGGAVSFGTDGCAGDSIWNGDYRLNRY